uniref:FRG domain-containing protein n=1 Tax=Lactococcus lactis TaxID=1358 RepID=UPI0022E6EAA3
RLNNEEIKSINYLLKNITSEQLISLLKIQDYKVDEINYLFNNISNIKLSGDNNFYLNGVLHLNKNELESLDYLFEKISNLKPRPKNIGSFIKKIINIIKNNEERERFYDHNSDYNKQDIITNMLHQENLTQKYDEYSHSSYKDILNNLEKKSATQSEKDMSDFIILDYLSQNIENESIITFFQHIISTIESNYDSLIKIHHKSLLNRYSIPNDNHDLILNDERKSIKLGLYEDKDKETNYLYNQATTNINTIDSISSFTSLLSFEGKTDNRLFFRGHSNSNYMLKPSIFRNPKIFSKENRIYEESLARNPEEYDFNNRTHLDILKKMQHYGIPTRLMDITENLLTGLYFAVETDDVDGELIVFSVNTSKVKYTRSDNVSILCSLPPFSPEEKQKIFSFAKELDTTGLNKEKLIKRLRHEVSTEKPFEPEIDPNSFSKDYFVIPKRDNRRIIQQNGSFIVCCLNPISNSKINDKRFKNYQSGKHEIFIIPSKMKTHIRSQLNLYGINQATIYPEIEKVSEFLKNTII